MDFEKKQKTESPLIIFFLQSLYNDATAVLKQLLISSTNDALIINIKFFSFIPNEAFNTATSLDGNHESCTIIPWLPSLVGHSCIYYVQSSSRDIQNIKYATSETLYIRV